MASGEQAAREEDGVTCIHRWRIDEPAGATSRGVCRICGAEKLFRNYEVAPWSTYAERVMEVNR